MSALNLIRGRSSRKIIVYLDYNAEVHNTYIEICREWNSIATPRLLIEGAVNTVTAKTPPKAILEELSALVRTMRNPLIRTENWDMNNWISDGLRFYALFQKNYAKTLQGLDLHGEYNVVTTDFGHTYLRLALEKP